MSAQSLTMETQEDPGTAVEAEPKEERAKEEQSGVTFICSTCKEECTDGVVVAKAEGEGKDTKRCRNCHNLQARLHRLIKHRPDLEGLWGDQSVAQRADFFKEHHLSMGHNLEMAVSQLVTASKSHVDTTRFSAEAQWLDEEDVRSKFQGKPQQVESILQNARHMFCPARQVMMYEIPDYKTANINESIKEEKKSMDLECHGLRPPAPKAASLRKPRAIKDKGVEAEPVKVKRVEAEPAEPKAKKQKVPKIAKTHVARLQKMAEALHEQISATDSTASEAEGLYKDPTLCVFSPLLSPSSSSPPLLFSSSLPPLLSSSLPPLLLVSSPPILSSPKEFVPAALLQHTKLKVADGKEVVARVELSLASGEGVFKELSQAMQEVAAELTEAGKKLRVQMEQALALMPSQNAS